MASSKKETAKAALLREDIEREMHCLMQGVLALRAASMMLCTAIDQEELPESEMVDGLFYSIYDLLLASHERLEFLLKR